MGVTKEEKYVISDLNWSQNWVKWAICMQKQGTMILTNNLIENLPISYQLSFSYNIKQV